MPDADPPLVANRLASGEGPAAGWAPAAAASRGGAAAVCTREEETLSSVGESRSRWSLSAWMKGTPSAERRGICATTTTTTSVVTAPSPQAKRSSYSGGADSSSNSAGSRRAACKGGAAAAVQQNSSRDGCSRKGFSPAAGSRRTDSGLDSSNGGGHKSTSGSSAGNSSSTGSDRWVRFAWTPLRADRQQQGQQQQGQQHQEQQQPTPESLISRLLRKSTVMRRETDSSRGVGGGRPTFERRRKRYRTVSWKYKKSIGFLASFVFLCNQILAPGLTSMPLTLIEYGWLPSLLVNLLFCVLSTLCSLVLLRSVTLIEGNHNFDERFEYSATLRHFLAPPATDLPAGAAAARSAASGAKTAAPASRAAASSARAAAVAGSALGKPFCFFKSLLQSSPARSSAQQKPLVSVEAGGSAVAGRAAVGGAVDSDGPPENATSGSVGAAAQGSGRASGKGSAVTSSVSRFLVSAAATASYALSGLGNICGSSAKRKEEHLFGRPAANAADSSGGGKGGEEGSSCCVSHPSSDSSSTRHSDYSQTFSSSSGEEQAAASPVVFCMQAVGGGLPSFLLRRALYGLRRLSEGQPTQRMQQQQQQQQTRAAPQQQEEEQVQWHGSTGEWDAAAGGTETHRRGSAHHQQIGGNKGGGVHRSAAAESTTATRGAAVGVCKTAVPSAANSETCHAKRESRDALKDSTALAATSAAAATDFVDSAATIALGTGSSGRAPAAQHSGRGLLRGILPVAECWLSLWQLVHAVVLSPLHMVRWFCSLPRRLLEQLHAAVVRPPPLLPSSFPRLLSWLLHLNTFLSTCSAALLVAYCIDCLLLRVFSCSLFIPLLPTHVSSGAVLEQYGDGWMSYSVAVCHSIGAVFALLLQPFCAIASLAAFLFDSLTAVGAALAAAAAAAGGTGFTLTTENASAADAGAQVFERMRQLGNALLLQGSQLFVFSDIAAVRQISEWLSGSLRSLLSLVGNSVVEGFLQEQRIAALYGVPRMPFLYVLPSQHHIEEVFSGVCSSSSNSCSAPQSSPAGRSSLFAAFLSGSSAAVGSGVARSFFDLAEAGAASHASGVTAAVGDWGSSFHYAAGVAAASAAQECLPQCVSHMGISVGYIITAAICLHLAAADLQENARMQLLSFGAIIAAVLQVSCSAALMLLFPPPIAAAVAQTAAAEAFPDAAAAAAGLLSVTAASGDALPSTGAARSSAGAHPTHYVAGGGLHAARALGRMPGLAAGAGLAETEGSSLACCVAEPSGLAAAFYGPPTTPAAAVPILPCRSGGACTSGDSARVSAAPATATAATNAAGSQTGAGAVPRPAWKTNDETRAESSWPSMIVRGSGMGALVSTFVDAYSYSNALPSWANEIKDNIQVTQTLFMSTTFACTIYFLFGVLCAAAFPAFSASSNVLAAMLPSCQSLVAASCICFFHIFALLPNIVTSQISRRYDLLNMAICLDKPSAFYVASTMPWMLYWLLTFSPVFATPSQLLTLLSNVLLNFAAPAVVYVYALHATAPPRLHVSAVADSISFREATEEVAKRDTAATPYEAGGAAAAEPVSVTAETRSHPNTYAVGDVRYEEEALHSGRQKQEEQGEATAASRDRSWQRGQMHAEGNCAAGVPYVRVKSSGTCETTGSSTVPLTESTYVSHASSFNSGAVAPLSPRAEQRFGLPRPSPQHGNLRFNRGGVLDASDGGDSPASSVVCADAGIGEQSPRQAVRQAAGDSFISCLTMQAVPEEECDSEEEGHAAAADDDDNGDDGEPSSSLPVSLSHLHQQQSYGSTSAYSSGSVSRWSTSCFGDKRATASREHDDLGGDDFLRTQSSSGFKRTQSQNVLSFQSRKLGVLESLGSRRASAAQHSCAPGDAAAAKGLGGSLLHRGSTNVLLGREREAETLGDSGGTAMTSAAGFKSGGKGEEKLGKMRVAGAVAGGGGARSREVQRQLQTWLEEYSRQMPESEVAQLLQRQQREEQQEEMRLQQRETEVKKDLRKKVENQWRRQHIFRADEETSPSPSGGGGGSPGRPAATLDAVPEQSRSSSLPPSARGGEAAAAEDNAAAGISGVSQHNEDREATGNPKLRRRSSRSLSCGRFLLPQQPRGPEETRAVTSAAGDDGGGAFAEDADAAAAAAPAAKAGASDLAAPAGEEQIAGIAGQEHHRARPVTGRGAPTLCAKGGLAGEEEPAAKQTKGGGRAVAAAVAVDEGRRQQLRQPFRHKGDDGWGRRELAGEKEVERKAEGAGTNASRSWDTLSREDASYGTTIVASSVSRYTSSSHGRSNGGSNAGTSSSPHCVVGEMAMSAVGTAAAVAEAFPVAAGHVPYAVPERTSAQIRDNLAAGSAVLVADAVLQDKDRQGQIQQDDELLSEGTGGTQAAPTFVRRTAKKSARIDSVSVALQQRRRDQLLKENQQQQGGGQKQVQEQPVQEQLVEEQQRLQHSQKEQTYKEQQPQLREPPERSEQEAEVETRHQDEALLRSAVDTQQRFKRSSMRRATCISRGHAHGDYTASAVQSCTHAGKATATAGALTLPTASAAVAGDKTGSAAEEVPTTNGREGEVADNGAGKGSSSSGVSRWSDGRSDRDVLPNEENNISQRSSISEDTGAHGGICNLATPRRRGLRVRIAAAAVRAVGWGNDLRCAVWARTQRKDGSTLDVHEDAKHSVFDDVGEQQQLPRGEIQPGVVHHEVWQQNVGAPQVSELQSEQRVALGATAQGNAASRGRWFERDCGSSEVSQEKSSRSHTYEVHLLAADLPAGAVEPSNISEGAWLGQRREGELRSAETVTQIPSAMAKRETASAPAVRTPATGLPTSLGVEEKSPYVPSRCSVLIDILKVLQSGIRSSLRGVWCGISNMWNVVLSRVFPRQLARGAGEDAALTQQQRQHQATYKYQERVSFFPWLRSTEEQLVATYALLAVVLYSAAAALADEMWSPLEPAWLYIWRHSCRLVSLLWEVRWPVVLLPLLPVATWVGTTLRSGVAAAEHLLLHFRDSYLIECASPWVSGSVKKMQRVADWLGGVGTSAAGRQLHQAYGAEGDTDGVDRFLGPETLQLQQKVPLSYEPVTAALEREAAARLGQGDAAAQVPLSARAALPTQGLYYVTEERGGNVREYAGLSAETFFIGLFLLIACTLPLLRYASPAKQGGRGATGSRRQSVSARSRS